jgi:hypothetical protein
MSYACGFSSAQLHAAYEQQLHPMPMHLLTRTQKEQDFAPILSFILLRPAMSGEPPHVTTGTKNFGAINNNTGVVLGDVLGPAQVIGVSINIEYQCITILSSEY